jgi:hypothetical protein
MPDEGGWYMLPQCRKKFVYLDYMKDCAEEHLHYSKCTERYFVQIWKALYRNVRLRKWCRFAKCNFCVSVRAIMFNASNSLAVRNDARSRLREHRDWANTLERGVYHSKMSKAICSPQEYISISLDGTSKFPQGFPGFPTKAKSDGNEERLKLHIEIAMVHGRRPRVFVAWEDIAGDANLITEILTRVLKAEENDRGVLPKILYLQLDNCARENKNTYLLMFLVWLVERNIFDIIYVSFLPVGHTHFDPDQLASRLGIAVQYTAVKTTAQLIDLFNGCYSPRPIVEWIHDTGDIKCLFNPTGGVHFPVGTSLVRQVKGCCTRVVHHSRAHFMGPTSPLHWMMRKDTNKRAILQSKLTSHDNSDWSEQHYGWTDAPRPNGRQFSESTSGVFADDIKICPKKVIGGQRRRELTTAIRNVKARLSNDEYASIMSVVDSIIDPPLQSLDPVDDERWKFAVEGAGVESDEEDQEDEEKTMSLNPQIIYHDANEQNSARAARSDGVTSQDLVVGNYLAYEPTYTDETKENERHEFWLGKIIQIDSSAKSVHIQAWHTGQKQNATLTGARYRLWSGDGKQRWVNIDRALTTFNSTSFTDKQRVKAAMLRRIRNAIELRKTNAILPEVS